MDTYLFEIQDSDLEIFDIPEDFDRSKFFEDDHYESTLNLIKLDVNFNQMLNGNYTL